MDAIINEVKLMLHDGKSETEIVNYLVSVHGIDSTLALTMVKRVKSSIENEANDSHPSKTKDYFLVVVTVLIVIGLVIGLAWSFWDRVSMILGAMFG